MTNTLNANLRAGQIPDGLLNLTFATENGDVEVHYSAFTPSPTFPRWRRPTHALFLKDLLKVIPAFLDLICRSQSDRLGNIHSPTKQALPDGRGCSQPHPRKPRGLEASRPCRHTRSAMLPAHQWWGRGTTWLVRPDLSIIAYRTS